MQLIPIAILMDSRLTGEGVFAPHMFDAKPIWDSFYSSVPTIKNTYRSADILINKIIK